MRNETDFQQAIDALMRGASLERLAQQYSLTPEEWENVIVAKELTSIQVVPRSNIRENLKEYLMVTAEQERLLGEHYREEPIDTESRKSKDSRPRWLMIILVLFAIVGGIGLLLALVVGAISLFTVQRSSTSYSAPPVEVYESSQPIEEFGRNTDNVYLVQQTPDAIFGGIFVLNSMIVTQNQYSPGNEIILIWEVTQVLNNERYSVNLTQRNSNGDFRDNSGADIAFPLETGATIATKHQMFDYRGDGAGTYAVEVVDRDTGENLLLSNGEERLLLRLQPAVTIPSQLIPEDEQPTNILPTTTPVTP